MPDTLVGPGRTSRDVVEVRQPPNECLRRTDRFSMAERELLAMRKASMWIGLCVTGRTGDVMTGERGGQAIPTTNEIRR